MNLENLAELARAVNVPSAAPATVVHSRLLATATPPADDDVEEWVVADAALAQRLVAAGTRVVLRQPALTLHAAPRLQGLTLEAVVAGADEAALARAVQAVGAALAAGLGLRAALAFGETGVDCFRAAAAAKAALGTMVPIRARWDGPLDVKGAALALTFGADELAGPLAPAQERRRLAQVGGPPEDGGQPSPLFVRSLIEAAGRVPAPRTR